MSTLELGIFAKTFARQSLEANLDAVVRHGLPVIQYNMACAGLSSLPEHIPPELAERVGAGAAARGIRIAAVSGTFNMIHPDLEQRRAGLRRLRVVAGACAALATHTITLCTGTRDPHDMWRGHADNRDPAAWSDLLTSMEVALAIADEADLLLGIEPEIANVVDSVARAQLLLREMRSPRLKIVLDPANLLHAEDLPRQYFILGEACQLLGPHIIMAHAKDVRVVDGEIRHVAAGTGLLDYSHYLSLLRHVPAPLIVHGLSETEVPWSLAYVRATSAGIGRRGHGGEAMPAFCMGEVTFNYVDVGTGVPFVFQHGLGGDVRQPVSVFMPQPGVRLLALDARAHGDTVWCGDPLELNFDTFADDLIAWLNHVGVARAVVGGISMGAGVALNVAVRYPERVAGLVLSRPAWLDRPMPPRTVALYALIARLLRTLDYSAHTDEGLDWAWRRLQQDPAFANIAERYPDCAWSLRGQLTARRAVDGVARLERLPRERPIADLGAAATIRVPTLVLAHHDDPIHPHEFGTILARAIPGAQFVEVTPKSVDRQGHEAQMQHAITAFLDQQLDARAAVCAAA